MNKAIPYDKKIENKLREGIRNGLTIKVIFDSIRHYQNSPQSVQTLYNKYGAAIAEERASLQTWLGDKARKRIEEGSDAVLIHALKTKAGWNSPVEVKEVDDKDPDENLDAISLLAKRLGIEDTTDDSTKQD